MGEGSARIYNIISLIFVFLTVVVIIMGVARLLGPAPTPPETIEPPAVLELPTLTPTPTASDTPIPTWTYTPTNTETPVLTDTPGPTEPPTATITPTPTITPSLTITPTLPATATEVPTEPPTVEGQAALPTQPPSPFPFRLRNNQVAFTNNFANSAGCQWQGFGGAVFDLNGQPLNEIRVHVYGDNVDLYTTSGTNTLYGQGGWEVQVANGINTNTYYVELQSQGGTVISDTVQVTFPGGCETNLAVANFEQTRPF